MKTESAEMTKHAINSFLAMSVPYTNEIASLLKLLEQIIKKLKKELNQKVELAINLI